MTNRHVIDGLMRATRSRTAFQCEVKLGLPGGTFTHMHQRNQGFNVAILDRMQQRSGVSFDQIMAWWRLPEDAVLGRVEINQGCALCAARNLEK
jgi:hypothetical protein